MSKAKASTSQEFVPWITPWKKTARHKYYDHVDGRWQTMTVSYGLSQQEGQEPYFAMTGKTGKNSSNLAIGHLVEAFFPALASFAKWHLANESGPPFYPNNGVYWWEVVIGLRDKPPRVHDPLDVFKESIVFGEVADDEIPPFDTPPNIVGQWLASRSPALRQAFREAMTAVYELEV